MTTSAKAIGAAAAMVFVVFGLFGFAQQPGPLNLRAVRPIQPPAHPLPPESATAGITRFSFIAYGDTRCDCRLETVPNPPAGGPGKPELEPEHTRVIDALVAKVKAMASGRSPVKFVVQSGDAVYRGSDPERWNEVFTPLVERITRGLDLPFFFVPGNHDVTGTPISDPRHALGLHDTLAAMSRLMPPEGSPRRLNGYGTFSFGYGNTFFIGFDSNIANDALQLAWVTDQLEHLDRSRFRHVVVFFHHPPYDSGRYSGVTATGTFSNGVPVSGGVAIAAQATAIRSLYMPLFRKHHVRLLLMGHDHLFDHWAERWVDGGSSYRMDEIVSGGGGAPTYVYTGEPNLDAYIVEGKTQQLRVEHIAKPEPKIEDNPHHFVVVHVDGDKLSLEIVGTGVKPYTPWNGKATIDLTP
jgi:3',5'-cyclic AMP phosphodiesterase CpdA